MADPALAFAKVGSKDEDPFDLEGDLLDGQIRVGKVVGEGELSVVYRGLHEGMQAPVAIKCLDLPETLDPKLVEPISERFCEGARLHYRLAQGHLHIVQTLAVGSTLAPRTGRAIAYVVREWLEGCSLAFDFETRARAKLRPRTPAQAIELLESAAGALAFAHDERISHHALNPGNLFLAKTRDGAVVKVLDFGAARDSTLRAEAGLRLLFSSHAAPEQLDRSLGEPGAATDVFAFALIFFEAIAGRPLFAPLAHPTEVLRLVAGNERLSRRAPGVFIPRDVEMVLVRALAARPAERQPNMRVFWDELKTAVLAAKVASSMRPKAVLPSLAPPPPSPASCTAEVARPVVLDATPSAPMPAAAPFAVAAPAPPAVAATGIAASAPSAVAALPAVAASAGAAVAPSASPRASQIDRDTIPAPPPFEELPATVSRESLRARTTDLLVQSSKQLSDSLGPWLESVRTDATRWAANVSVENVRRGAIFASLALATGVVAIAAAASARGHVPAAVQEQRPPRRYEPSKANELVVPGTERAERRIVAAVPRFDYAAAMHVLDEVAADLDSCAEARRPRGPGSVRFVIEPSGRVSRLTIGPPYAGTTVGACVANRFLSAPLPSYSGVPRWMNYVFNTIPYR